MEQGSSDECVPANSYVTLHINDVLVNIASKLCVLAKTVPVIACGLLQHESKISVLHFRYSLNTYLLLMFVFALYIVC